MDEEQADSLRAFPAKPGRAPGSVAAEIRMDDLYRDAAPSRGHLGIAALVATGKMPAVITQNIDNLHQASGLSDDQVIELHGNGTYATCLDCGARHELPDIRSRFEATGEAPCCQGCGGIVKSATVSFGQAMPAGRMRAALELALASDLFLVLGSSWWCIRPRRCPRWRRKTGRAW